MDEERNGRSGLFPGCNSISKKIFARASSSELFPKEEHEPSKMGSWWNHASPRKRFKTLSPGAIPAAIASKFKRSSGPKPGLGTIQGVLIPVMENMWGVLIFLRFYYIVGNAGIWQTYLVVGVSFLCAFITSMSLSAVATNGPIEEGGTYYLISRALGPKLGGTVGIMYYLGVLLLSVLESLGAVEMLRFTFHALEFPSANRVLGASIILFLSFLVCFGINFVSKLSMLFFIVVLYTMGSYYMGLFVAPRHHNDAPSNLTGLKWHTFEGNWNSGYNSGVSFKVVLSIFFPCYTGILSGADRAKNLARPDRSIPRGTIGAVVISLVVYLSYMSLWGAVGTRDYLLGRDENGTRRSTGQNLEAVKDVAWPLDIITQLGIIIASMAQALQCLITSPRLLQAIANDGVIPFLVPLSKTSKTGEPTRALLVTAILCVCAAMFGSLDAVAPLVSICFLTAYAALNASCFVLDISKAPSWRPKWKFFHWIPAAAGCLLCIVLSFVIKWYWALACLVIQFLLFGYIDYHQVEVDWGSGLGGLQLRLAVHSIIKLSHEARYTVNWRPQLLLLLKPRSSMGPNDQSNEELMLLGSQLKKGQGLCVIATILEGTMQRMVAQRVAEKLELENTIEKLNVPGFVRVLVAPTYRQGKSFAIQSSGLGALEPNTLFLGWPNDWHDEGHYHNAEVMLEILDECKAANKSSVLCMNLKEFPSEKDQEEGYIDVWWMVHDGGMLILLAHLLKRHRIWRKCTLRVNTITDEMHDKVLVEKNLKGTLNKNRIEAEVRAFDMPTGGLAPYTYDTTIRLEEAQDFARQVAEFRLRKDQHERPQMSRQGSVKPLRKDGSGSNSEVAESSKSPTSNAIAACERLASGNLFEKSSDLQSSQSPEVRNSRGEYVGDQIRKSDNQSSTANIGRSSGQQDDSDIVKLGQSKRKMTSPAEIGRKAEDILKKTVPGEISMLEGKEYQPRGRGFLHALKAHVVGDSDNKENDVAAESSHIKGGKETRWAIDINNETKQEITVEDKTDGRTENVEEDSGLHVMVPDDSGEGGIVPSDRIGGGMVRKDSAGQIYPGSPHSLDYGSGDSTIDIPEVVNRTWETFSQDYSPDELNERILERSKDAKLVLLNLPDHYEGMEPARYMEYCEKLTRGLRRVLLVSGTGKELWRGE